MLKNTLFVILLMISSLFTACAEGYVSDVQKEDDTKEIRFSLNMEGGLTMFPTRSSVSLDGMKWTRLQTSGRRKGPWLGNTDTRSWSGGM